jgi:hypothetical protein
MFASKATTELCADITGDVSQIDKDQRVTIFGFLKDLYDEGMKSSPVISTSSTGRYKRRRRSVGSVAPVGAPKKQRQTEMNEQELSQRASTERIEI